MTIYNIILTSIKMITLLLHSVLLAAEADVQNLDTDKQKVVQHFIDLVKHNDKEMLATSLGRQYPLPGVNSKGDFIRRYSEIFDDNLRRMIINSDPAKDWSEIEWQGIMLKNGAVWLDPDGRLTSVNYQSAWEEKERQRLIKEDRERLHPTLQTYTEPVLIMETSTYRIRIDDLGRQSYRYTSWKKEHGMEQQPDIVIVNGTVHFDGNGGNHHYTFQNNDYTYICDIVVIGNNDSTSATLTVSRGDKNMITQKATLLLEDP